MGAKLMLITNIIALFLGFLATYISLPYFLSMLIEGKCLEKNYLNYEIPICVGVIFVIIQSFNCILVSFIYPKLQLLVFYYCIFVVIISIVSLLDDLVGEKEIKGFKGHMLSLLDGKLTTGCLKALVGLLSSIILSLKLSEDFQSIIINVLLIVLFTNTINMFDLRPGRGLKVFILLSIIMISLAINRDLDFVIFSVLGIVIAYLPNDIKGLSMMGDVGSNFLGITIGFYSAVCLHSLVKITLLVLLIIIHILGEFFSFSRIINKNKVLRYFDNLGRQQRRVNSD